MAEPSPPNNLLEKFGYEKIQWIATCLFIYHFLHGIILGFFSGMLSKIEIDFVLTSGQFGDVLSTAAIGATIALMFVPNLISKLGSAHTAVLGAVLFTFSATALAISTVTNLYVGVLAMVLTGLAIIWVDAPINTQVAHIETIFKFPLFGRLQGTMAVGGAAGALIAAEMVDLNYSCWFIELLGSILFFPFLFYLLTILLSHHEEKLVIFVKENEKIDFEKANPSPPTSSSTRNNLETQQLLTSQTGDNASYGTANSISEPVEKVAASSDQWTLFLLFLIILLTSFADSAIIDWSELYLEANWNASSEVGALGFVGFEIGLAMSRFLSDYLVYKFGRKELLVYGCLLSGLGLAVIALMSLASGNDTAFVFVVLTFVLVGFCLGPVTPVCLGFAANLKGFQAGDAIPLLAVAGVMGLVIAPLFDGNVVQWLGYGLEFFFQAGLLITAAMFSITTKERYFNNKKRRNSSDEVVADASNHNSNTGGARDSIHPEAQS